MNNINNRQQIRLLRTQIAMKFKKLSVLAKAPERGSLYAAGLDLFTIESADILPGQRAKLKTGIAIEIPENCVGLIWPRSKLAVKYGIDVLAGVVDSDYRGEVMISLLNTSDKTVEIRVGDKAAQIIIQRFSDIQPVEVEQLSDTERGSNGVNSSEMRLR